jgi:hypothetical protein
MRIVKRKGKCSSNTQALRRPASFERRQDSEQKIAPGNHLLICHRRVLARSRQATLGLGPNVMGHYWKLLFSVNQQEA